VRGTFDLQKARKNGDVVLLLFSKTPQKGVCGTFPLSEIT